MRSIKIGGGNEIRYKIKNARVIELYTDSIGVLETTSKKGDEIEKLTVETLEVSVGSLFKHGNPDIPGDFEVESIQRGADDAYKYRHRYTITSHKRNKTTTYLLPCLGENKDFFDVEGYMINAYLDKDLTKLYLVYRFATTDYYSELETRLLKHSCIKRMDTRQSNFDVFEFEIPDEYLEDIKLFRQGKYSKLSDLLKLKIRKFYGLTNKSYLWKVLVRDKELVSKFEKSLGLPMGFYWTVDLDDKPKMKEEIWHHC